MRSRRARYLPTALLPEPIGPIRNTLFLPTMMGAKHTQTKRRPEGRRWLQLRVAPELSGVRAGGRDAVRTDRTGRPDRARVVSHRAPQHECGAGAALGAR